MAKLTRLEIRALIDKLVVKAEALEMEAIAKSRVVPDTPKKQARRLEGIVAQKAAKIVRRNIQELNSLLLK
jgi:ribosomal protein L19E